MASSLTENTVTETPQERFRKLAAEWKEKSRHMSNVAQMAMLRALTRRSLGWVWRPVPLILEELPAGAGSVVLKRLEMITDVTPVPPEAAGKLREMACAWIEWG